MISYNVFCFVCQCVFFSHTIEESHAKYLIDKNKLSSSANRGNVFCSHFIEVIRPLVNEYLFIMFLVLFRIAVFFSNEWYMFGRVCANEVFCKLETNFESSQYEYVSPEFGFKIIIRNTTVYINTSKCQASEIFKQAICFVFLLLFLFFAVARHK